MGRLRRLERLVRSQILGAPFVAANMMTHWEFVGRENLSAALARRAEDGRGLVTISNHLSLFDDPLVIAEALGLRSFTVESKCWWSTPCESNFDPRGPGLAPRFVRYFSEVSNMVFFARLAKKGRPIELSTAYAPALSARGGPKLMERVEARAGALGLDPEQWLDRFLTKGDETSSLAPLNQPGMVEACARVSLGDWLHFFPEGGRSRSLELRPARRGVGKVLYHNPDALVLPFCFYGTQEVMPVRSMLPRPFKRVVVTFGEPVEAHTLLAGAKPTAESFEAVAQAAWRQVVQLRPATLIRYLGHRRAIAQLYLESQQAPADAVEPAPPAAPSPPRRRPLPRPEVSSSPLEQPR